ncbi:hypothetical protein FE257_011883 [Aspergillus nanangensis]|uniref:Glycoside hydrolase family 30 protein n=1 Tax=Aspergillus nanangensis TaxID=2582783 RepID=A0AAD4GR87_ASPNN|nr:hypothetical protein FE257_011883 [Aspergillus nanangensis]
MRWTRPNIWTAVFLSTVTQGLRHSKLPRQASTIVVDTSTVHQTIDGFGFSEAFGHAAEIQALDEDLQQQVLDMLFDPSKGAGFTILRNRIGSTAGTSIEPTGPGSPDAEPTYTWDGDDSGQVWLSQQAIKYNGNSKIYADAWSAPGYMKTNNDEANGGYLCGVTDQTCQTEDWKQAYADYLVKYVQLYAQEGVDITHLGFLNEPSYTPDYSSMNSDGQQAADFLAVLRSTVKDAGLSTSLTCCDDFGWDDQADLLSGIQATNGEEFVDIITVHTYASQPTYKMNTSKPVWMTEACVTDPWSITWYESGAESEGYTWANRIFTAIVDYDVSAYLYWIGAEAADVNSFLVNWRNDVIETSGRFWAFAQWSRYVQVGATRVNVTGSPDGVKTGAFRNPDDTFTMNFLNTNDDSVTVSVDLSGVAASGVKGYVTDNNNSLGGLNATFSGGIVGASLPGRSMVALVLS